MSVALTLAQERGAGEPMTIAASLELLAWIALAADDLDDAGKRLAEAWREAGEFPPWAQAVRLNLLIDEAVLAYRREDFPRCVAVICEWLPHARASNSRQDRLLALLLFAGIASRVNHPDVAARWFGTLSAELESGEHGMHWEPAIRPWHEADLARTRAALGTEFEHAWSAGSRTPLAAALAEAEGAVREWFGALAGSLNPA